MAIEEVKFFANCVLLAKSSASSDKNKTVRVTDTLTGTTWSGSLGTNLYYKFVLPNRAKYKVELLSGSTVQYTTYIELGFGEFRELEVGLDKSTWAGIKKIIDAKQASAYITSGDKFNVTLSTGEALVYQANVNTYGLGEVDFIPTYCLEALNNMNSSNTNAGGWNAANRRKWLNETFFAQLPADLQAVISEKTLKRSQGSQSTVLIEATDKIWLPTETEVFGNNAYGAATEVAVQKQYPIFPDQNSRVRTQGKNGAACPWWESSPRVSLSTAFCTVHTTGTPDSYSAGTAYGVLPCFRIAPES